MDRVQLVVHGGALTATFLALSVGTYGLLRELAALGLWPLQPAADRPWHRDLVHRLGRLAADNSWFAKLRRESARDLVRARQIDTTADDFIGECLAYGAAGAAAAWLLTVLVGGAPWNVVPAAVAAAILFQVPHWNLRSRAHRRITALTRRLPYSLEVVVLAAEAGAGFEEALAILVREDPDEPLHEEFDQVLRDTHLGVTRREALHAMSTRVDTEDVASLVMALEIAEDLGTPAAATLKKQAETIRNNRLQRAERLAREAGPKMALPNTMIMVANVLLILAPFLPKLTALGGR
jgi:Flp pilus assembly protein TadB